MPYIGQQPTSGLFIELDSLTASATANYDLQLNGAYYYPESVNNLLVSINGVIQGSNTLSLSGYTLTVGATLSSSDTIDFVRVFGNVGTISTPTDGSVTANKIASGAVTSAKLDTNIAIDGTLDVTGEITESGKEYFHVDLTTDQSGTDGSSSVVDLGGSGTVVYDSKSNFDSTNDAYLLGSSDGVYLISFSIGIATDSITSEAIIYARGGVQVATDGSTFSDLKGSGQQMRNSDGDNGGSVVLSGSFIYKATTSTTKIRMLVLAELTGTPDHIIVSSVEELTQSVTALADARPTWLTVVRIA